MCLDQYYAVRGDTTVVLDSRKVLGITEEFKLAKQRYYFWEKLLYESEVYDD